MLSFPYCSGNIVKGLHAVLLGTTAIGVYQLAMKKKSSFGIKLILGYIFKTILCIHLKNDSILLFLKT